MELMEEGVEGSRWCGEEEYEVWAGTGVIWNKVDMLCVWARHLTWWAEAEEGMRGASVRKVICWPKLEKVMVKVV